MESLKRNRRVVYVYFFISVKCQKITKYYIDIVLLWVYIRIVRREKMVVFNLRLGKELYKKIRQLAADEDRSINGMLLHIIKKYIGE